MREKDVDDSSESSVVPMNSVFNASVNLPPEEEVKINEIKPAVLGQIYNAVKHTILLNM